jgi:hypothetical protein
VKKRKMIKKDSYFSDEEDTDWRERLWMEYHDIKVGLCMLW